MMDPPKLRTILLFPPHVSPNPATLPLLKALQSLLNVSYTSTYCAHPNIFGTSHIRLADPSQFADIIGADGFTVVIFADKSDNNDEEFGEPVATGSVKAFDDEDVRKRAQWAPRAVREGNIGNDADANSIATRSEELDEKLEALCQERRNPNLTHELRAFAVAPTYQGRGLGVAVLETLEWLLGSDGALALDSARGADAPSFARARTATALSTTETGTRAHGIDLDEVQRVCDRSREADVAGARAKETESGAVDGVGTSLSQLSHRKVVLVAIRELGNEEYYRKRGYKTLGTGILPVGTWGSLAECTTVYMEKDL